MKGEDLIRLGLPPGPNVGKTLRDVESWWIGTDFKADRAACLEKAQSLLGV